MSTNTEKILSLMKDQDFMNRIIGMEDNAEVQKAFAEYGVDLTVEQIDAIAEMAFSNQGELDETELETVAGGGLEEIGIIISGIKTLCDYLTEINKARKSRGKKAIW